MKVSIIIVNYKTPKLLDTCIGSIYKYFTGSDFEIIVVDNNSEDTSESLIKEKYCKVHWIGLQENVGFGIANNEGINASKGEYVLLLNSDTELYEDAITKTLNHYQELEKSNKVGLVGCKVMYNDGRLQPSCNYYWAGLREVIEEHPIGIKILQHWLKIKKLRSIDKYERLNSNHEITWLGVPFAIIKKSVLEKNLFDPHFFLYSEDEELNYRLSSKGYKPYFFSETGIYHHIGASSSNNELRQKQILFSKLLFILKSRGKIYFKIYIYILKSVYKWNSKLSNSNEFSSNDLSEGVKKISEIINSNSSLNLYK